MTMQTVVHNKNCGPEPNRHTKKRNAHAHQPNEIKWENKLCLLTELSFWLDIVQILVILGCCKSERKPWESHIAPKKKNEVNGLNSCNNNKMKEIFKC